nr:WD repeat-containing protein 3 [Cryptomonas sp.]
MIWISTKKSIFIPEIMPSLSMLSDRENIFTENFSNLKKTGSLNQCKKKEYDKNLLNNDDEEMFEDFIDESQSFVITSEYSQFKNFVNFYVLEISNKRIFNFFLHHQKQTTSNIKCIEPLSTNFINQCHCENLFATGNENGEIYIWQIEDVKLNEPVNVFGNYKCKSSKMQKTSPINDISWNKINTSILLACSENGWITCVDLNSQKTFNLIKAKESRPRNLNWNPFNRSEYIVLLENSSYFISDCRFKKYSTFVKTKKQVDVVKWIFSDNLFFQIERSGFISLFDKRYINKLDKPNYLLRVSGISNDVVNCCLCDYQKKIALVDIKGSISAWEMKENFKFLNILNKPTPNRTIKNIIWSPLEAHKNILLTVDEKLAISIV